MPPGLPEDIIYLVAEALAANNDPVSRRTIGDLSLLNRTIGPRVYQYRFRNFLMVLSIESLTFLRRLAESRYGPHVHYLEFEPQAEEHHHPCNNDEQVASLSHSLQLLSGIKGLKFCSMQNVGSRAFEYQWNAVTILQALVTVSLPKLVSVEAGMSSVDIQYINTWRARLSLERREEFLRWWRDVSGRLKMLRFVPVGGERSPDFEDAAAHVFRFVAKEVVGEGDVVPGYKLNFEQTDQGQVKA